MLELFVRASWQSPYPSPTHRSVFHASELLLWPCAPRRPWRGQSLQKVSRFLGIVSASSWSLVNHEVDHLRILRQELLGESRFARTVRSGNDDAARCSLSALVHSTMVTKPGRAASAAMICCLTSGNLVKYVPYFATERFAASREGPMVFTVLFASAPTWANRDGPMHPQTRSTAANEFDCGLTG